MQTAPGVRTPRVLILGVYSLKSTLLGSRNARGSHTKLWGLHTVGLDPGGLHSGATNFGSGEALTH